MVFFFQFRETEHALGTSFLLPPVLWSWRALQPGAHALPPFLPLRPMHRHLPRLETHVPPVPVVGTVPAPPPARTPCAGEQHAAPFATPSFSGLLSAHRPCRRQCSEAVHVPRPQQGRMHAPFQSRLLFLHTESLRGLRFGANATRYSPFQRRQPAVLPVALTPSAAGMPPRWAYAHYATR